MKRNPFILVALFLTVCNAFSQKVSTVTGAYDYIMPSTMTLQEARVTAIERAKLEALANEFGTILSQTNMTMVSDENARSKNSFYSLGSSEVKGEWIETIEEKVEEQVADGQHIIKAWVKGKAREITFAKVSFETHLLRNGKGDEFEAEDFRDGDRFYVSFRSPAKGYLAIYLLDADRNASRIVPSDDEESCRVVRGTRYVFVDDEKRHLILNTSREQEIDQVYIIFSPNKFYTELDIQNPDNSDLVDYKQGDYNQVYHLPYVPFKKFQNWIGSLRKKDSEVQVVTRFIKISKRR
ncbi:MAG: hypothetical protein IJ588_06325 [Prevotella sp.]|nr:hypothetical protein [Prevotella sp.]